MYLPIFRGRQYELLALRDLVNENLLSANIIPIIEPVKVSSTFFATLEAFINKSHEVSIILNPRVGEWEKELQREVNSTLLEKYSNILSNKYVIPCYYANSDISLIENDDCILIINNQDSIEHYEKAEGIISRYNLIPDKGEFRRRVRKNRVILENHFHRQERNSDYALCEEEFFSSDHLYYSEDSFKGFSDYSVIGEEYNDSGFAPYAVAIHIVYFNKDYSLRIKHFVSDSNFDIKDVAGKFLEAVRKLEKWNDSEGLDTFGINKLIECAKKETYPGLGVVKKYSIMHHLELIGSFIDLD